MRMAFDIQSDKRVSFVSTKLASSAREGDEKRNNECCQTSLKS